MSPTRSLLLMAENANVATKRATSWRLS